MQRPCRAAWTAERFSEVAVPSLASEWRARTDEMRAYAATFRADIPSGWFVCGENLTATQSLRYSRLLPEFMVFSVWAGDTCLFWADTVGWAGLLGLATAVLYEDYV